MKNTYSEKEIRQMLIEKVSQMVHKHYCENDSEFVIEQFDDDVIWVGAGEHESAQGLETIAGIFREFEGKIPKCDIYDEIYDVQKISPKAYLCSAKMWIATKPETGMSMRVHQRMTFVFRWKDDGPKCCHLHISNPYDDMSEGDIGFPFKIANQSYQYLQEQIEEQTEILKRLSYEDLLTGVYNRNKFIEDIKDAYLADIPHIGIAYFDLNGLKLINDLYGHNAGDELICNVASHLWQAFEKKVYRTGGDEFVVVDTELDEVSFRQEIYKAEESMKNDGISFSTGISWRSTDCNIEEQFKEADSLMYQEKRSYYKMKKKDA